MRLPAMLNPFDITKQLPDDARSLMKLLIDLVIGADQFKAPRPPAIICEAAAAASSSSIPATLLEAIAEQAGSGIGNAFGLPEHIAVQCRSDLQMQARTAAKALELRTEQEGIAGALVALYGPNLAGAIAATFALRVAIDAEPEARAALAQATSLIFGE